MALLQVRWAAYRGDRTRAPDPWSPRTRFFEKLAKLRPTTSGPAGDALTESQCAAAMGARHRPRRSQTNRGPLRLDAMRARPRDSIATSVADRGSSEPGDLRSICDRARAYWSPADLPRPQGGDTDDHSQANPSRGRARRTCRRPGRQRPLPVRRNGCCTQQGLRHGRAIDSGTATQGASYDSSAHRFAARDVQSACEPVADARRRRGSKSNCHPHA